MKKRKLCLWLYARWLARARESIARASDKVAVNVECIHMHSEQNVLTYLWGEHWMACIMHHSTAARWIALFKSRPALPVAHKRERINVCAQYNDCERRAEVAPNWAMRVMFDVFLRTHNFQSTSFSSYSIFLPLGIPPPRHRRRSCFRPFFLAVRADWGVVHISAAFPSFFPCAMERSCANKIREIKGRWITAA